MSKVVKLAGALLGLGIGAAAFADTAPSSSPIKIAVFPFELEDFSAAGEAGSAPDEAKYLMESTEEAKQLLLKSGRYLLVDTGTPSNGQDLRDCNGCEAATAAKLGANQSVLGIVTKISMTEYTVRMLVRDAPSGQIVSNLFTDLRIGAHYAWARGVRRLIENRMLADVKETTPQQRE